METKVSSTPLFCSVIEAGRILGIGRSSAYLLLESNTLRSVKHGKRRLVIMASITTYADSLIASSTVPAKGL
jgi:hypothetical protein